jgi:hypothetical protein
MNDQPFSLPKSTHCPPKSRSRTLLIAAFLVVSCVAVAVWWKLTGKNSQDIQHLDLKATSAVPANGVSSPTSGTLSTNASGSVAAEPPPANLHDALRRAQVAASKKPAPRPTAQALAQPDRSAPNEEKLKAFGKMFNTALASQQPDTSAANPFGQVNNQ